MRAVGAATAVRLLLSPSGNAATLVARPCETPSKKFTVTLFPTGVPAARLPSPPMRRNDRTLYAPAGSSASVYMNLSLTVMFPIGAKCESPYVWLNCEAPAALYTSTLA